MAKTARDLRAEKEQIRKEMAANSKKLGQIRNRKDPGDRPKNPGAALKANSKAARIKTPGTKPSTVRGGNSRIKTISKPVNKRRKILA